MIFFICNTWNKSSCIRIHEEWYRILIVITESNHWLFWTHDRKLICNNYILHFCLFVLIGICFDNFEEDFQFSSVFHSDLGDSNTNFALELQYIFNLMLWFSLIMNFVSSEIYIPGLMFSNYYSNTCIQQ